MMDPFELELLLILQQNRRVFGQLALSYKAHQRPDEKTLRDFQAIPQIAIMRAMGERTDLEIAQATTRVIEEITTRMESA